MEVYDLIVIGGGAAGCAASYSAAKSGLKTLLVESGNCLGGLMTRGLVVPAMKVDHENINTDFLQELIKTTKALGGEIEYFDKNPCWFNPEILKIALDKILTGVGAKILFESYPVKIFSKDNFVSDIEIETKMLSLHFKSKYFLDTSGDSIIFKLLGEHFYEENLEKQACSLRFTVGGVDIKKLEKFLLKHDTNRDVTNSCTVNGEIHLTSAYTFDSDTWNLKPIFEKALKESILEPFDTAYFQIFTIAGAKGEVAFNCPRMRNFNEHDPFDYSSAIIEARGAIYRLLNFVKKYFEGFENAYISQIASLTGVRESNKIIAENQLTELSSTKPESPVLAGDYPIDIHSNSKGMSTLKKVKKYYLDISSLKSKNYKNLFAAGRNLGAGKIAQSALRTQVSCMSMGEAVAKYIVKIC